MSTVPTRLAPVAILLALAACDDDDGPDNRVQDSSDAVPTWFVSVSVADGFVPDCEAIPTGDTVQWENLDPDVPANVTSLEDPPELYSPNLQGAYVTWSHTFENTGFYEYYDTNSGDPGTRIVDAYYGTVTYVGVSETTHRGAVCVQGDDEAPCCCTDFDCGLGEACVTNICTPQ